MVGSGRQFRTVKGHRVKRAIFENLSVQVAASIPAALVINSDTFHQSASIGISTLWLPTLESVHYLPTFRLFFERVSNDYACARERC
jgi:hypothetical protein